MLLFDFPSSANTLNYSKDLLLTRRTFAVTRDARPSPCHRQSARDSTRRPNVRPSLVGPVGWHRMGDVAARRWILVRSRHIGAIQRNQRFIIDSKSTSTCDGSAHYSFFFFFFFFFISLFLYYFLCKYILIIFVTFPECYLNFITQICYVRATMFATAIV